MRSGDYRECPYLYLLAGHEQVEFEPVNATSKALRVVRNGLLLAFRIWTRRLSHDYRMRALC
jgi:hypothetical protein